MFFSRKKDRLTRKKVRRWQITPLQKQFIAGVIILIVVALFVAMIYYVSRIDVLQIKKVIVVGGETIPHSVVQNVVEEELGGTYMRLIPKRFSPLYPKERIEARVSALDRIKHVQVQRSDEQSITVVFEEYVPYALWCEGQESRTCLFIDGTGYAFASSPVLQGSAFVRYVDEGTTPTVAASGFQRDFIKETEAFIAQLEQNLGLYVTHVFRRSTHDVEYTIAGGGIIKVSQALPMQESFENLQTILLSEEFKHIAPGSFQYIDLRFGEKIFVNEEAAAPETDTATSSASSSSEVPQT